MAEDWIKQARRNMRDFFSKATPEQIRALKEKHGYDVYVQGPSREEAAYALSDRVSDASWEEVKEERVNVYIMVGPVWAARLPVVSQGSTSVDIRISNGHR